MKNNDETIIAIFMCSCIVLAVLFLFASNKQYARITSLENSLKVYQNEK